MSSSEVIGSGTQHDAGGRDAPAPRRAVLRPDSPIPIYVGVALCVLGFGLLAYTWGRVADQVQVYQQLPYVVSGGFTGLALVLIGVTVVNIAAKRADAADRERQHDQLTAALRELHSYLAEDSR
ncbi:MAG TPA: hypothetical protein VNA14_13515 [Mycobacteriales bacterium]|nr:hypothetical protein [Mycobacteriales bacterium]